MDYKKLIEEIGVELSQEEDTGTIANYIPQLAGVNPNKFGVHISTLAGEQIGWGDSEEKFSIQSISKVLSLALAFKLIGEKIWERVGVEPSGNAFNSLTQLEYEKGIPRNPLINSGALVICDILLDHLKQPWKDFNNFVKEISGFPEIYFDPEVAFSEKQSGFRNKALANLIKSLGNLNNDVETVLDFYFQQCAIEMSCAELAQTFLFFANQGQSYISGKEILNSSKTKRINAVMHTCGFYDEAGEFSFRVGLPGKSGVGGGIVALHPGEYSVAVWSPRLNKKGNSNKGMKFLELLTTKTGMSIF